MNLIVSTWDDLSRDQLHAIIRLRIDVFVVEQQCLYSDLDGKDNRCLHLYSMKKDEVEASGASASSYLRICKPGISYVEPSIGRVATAADSRGAGLGKYLMKRGIQECENRWPGSGIRISAQVYLQRFYSNLGFEVCGETYLEDNIPHVQMFRK